MRYFLKYFKKWEEVTKEEYIAAERGSGFVSKLGLNELATSGFIAANGLRGTISYNDDDLSEGFDGH